MMQITINGCGHELEQDMTIADLLEMLLVARPGTAVAVNETIVPRDEHERRRIVAGDRVEIVRAIGGG